MSPIAVARNDHTRLCDSRKYTEYRSFGMCWPLITFRHASGILNVSSGPNRLIHSEFAEPVDQRAAGEIWGGIWGGVGTVPVGMGPIGVLSAFFASGRAARPLKTSYISPSPDTGAMTLCVSDMAGVDADRARAHSYIRSIFSTISCA